jgi:tetratricopeptide (TPR) repeat protein
MISWAAANRVAEKKKASDPKYREQLAGSPLLSDASALTDDELLERLRSLGVDIDRTSLAKLCEKSLSTEEIAKSFVSKRVSTSSDDEQIRNWIWICLTELWRRWFPEEPCFELLDEKMQDGYDLLKSGQAEAACSLWLGAWRNVIDIFDKTEMRSIEEFDDLFRGSQFLSNWVQDLDMTLWNTGLKQHSLLTARISICELILQRFSPHDGGKDHDITTGNWKRALAESYFETGQQEKAEALYREWMQNDPRWGWGWIGWSDCYFFGQPSPDDLEKSGKILSEGLSIADVRDRLDIMERLLGVYDKQGKSRQAKELSHQIRHMESAANKMPEFVASNAWRTKNVGEEPLLAYKAAANLVNSRKVSAQENIVGRKEPCPCGSGKKFKRCCGSGL